MSDLMTPDEFEAQTTASKRGLFNGRKYLKNLYAEDVIGEDHDGFVAAFSSDPETPDRSQMNAEELVEYYRNVYSLVTGEDAEPKKKEAPKKKAEAPASDPEPKAATKKTAATKKKKTTTEDVAPPQSRPVSGDDISRIFESIEGLKSMVADSVLTEEAVDGVVSRNLAGVYQNQEEIKTIGRQTQAGVLTLASIIASPDVEEMMKEMATMSIDELIESDFLPSLDGAGE